MNQYLNLCREILDKGIQKSNRTGIDTIGIHGAYLKFDLQKGFPIVTTKKLNWRSCFAEMLAFLRGYDNAAQFRRLGTKIWDANANSNRAWLNNTSRKGEDDLGRIYGVQAREWRVWAQEEPGGPILPGKTDQLGIIIDKLKKRNDDRRLIVTHWNPGELHEMALPPCHLLYQFGIEDDYLNLFMYQRSADVPLGVPFNISGYAWLLSVIAHITGLKPGTFHHFLWDAHIYINQIEGIHEQLERSPKILPQLRINPKINSLYDLETIATIDDFDLAGYDPWARIEFPFAV